ncbi:MAG: hypothetical protein ABI294_10615, partial [Casimicrobiaceae bacterium]
LVRRKLLMAMAIGVLGLVLAMAEIAAGWNSGFASYTYLLLVVFGIVRPARDKHSIKPPKPPSKSPVIASRE